MCKGANNVTLQKDFESFKFIYVSQISHMKLFLNEILCKLSLKIHIVAKRNTCFCSNNCWINMNLSTCVKFGGVCPKNNYHILKSHVNVLNNLGFFNFVLQNTFFFCMACTLHPIYMRQRMFEIFKFWKTFWIYKNFKFHTFKLWVNF